VEFCEKINYVSLFYHLENFQPKFIVNRTLLHTYVDRIFVNTKPFGIQTYIENMYICAQAVDTKIPHV
jgi:hypothetical protein